MRCRLLVAIDRSIATGATLAKSLIELNMRNKIESVQSLPYHGCIYLSVVIFYTFDNEFTNIEMLLL